MKLPIAWLKKYIDVTMSPEKLEEMFTMSGTKVEAIEKKGFESVIELEITTNRPDCLSILGLANEVSALTQKRVTLPGVYKKTVSSSRKRGSVLDSRLRGNDKEQANNKFQIIIEDKKACPKYTARIIRNVKIGPAPSETQKLLELTGTRAISNVVDATNFVLFESGQPLHAFDLDKIAGGKIVVRFSREGEKFLAIDGIEHTLDAKTLVVADAEKPIALAGVMGGKLTEVTAQTQNILLESACFDPALVRQASRKYRISTDSSYRFERGVDVALVEAASRRATELISLWASGIPMAALLMKDYTNHSSLRPISLRISRVEKILGMKVSQKRVISILRALSIEAKAHSKDRVTVKLSTSRRDIVLEEDVIEEILRIEGFEKIPTEIPVTRYGVVDPADRKSLRIPEVKNFLAALGFSEIIAYSLVSSNRLAKAGFGSGSAHRVVNPVSAEQEYFRPSLLPGILEVALFNINRKATTLKLFEVGDCYESGVESTRLGVFLYGSIEHHWARKSEASYFDLKGVAENLFSFLDIKAATIVESAQPAVGLSQHADIFYTDRKIGRIGKVSSLALKEFDIPRDAFYLEIVLDCILDQPKKSLRVKSVGKFPVVRRDIAFVADEKIAVADLVSLMKKTGDPQVQEVYLFDQYIGKNIPSGKRSLAFSLSYQKENGTFTDDEIQKLQDQVGQALKSQFAVEFR